MKRTDIYEKNGFVSIEEILKEAEDYSSGGDLENKIKGAGSKQNHKADLLGEIITDKVKFFKQILEEIDGQINDRKLLKDTIIKKIDDRMCLLTTRTYETEIWGMGHNKEIDSRRSKLESEIEALAKQKTDEEQQSWKDIALLKQEHRQFSQQYRDALRRTRIIMPGFKG